MKFSIRGTKFYLPITLIYILFLVHALTSCGGGSGSEDSIDNPVQEKVIVTAQEGYTLYQIGPTWDAKKLTSASLRERNDFLTTKVALSTIKISTPWALGTGFFLGKINNQYLVATSAHVLKNVPTCFAIPVYGRFEFLDRSYRCNSLIGIWPEIDLAIFTIKENKNENILGGLNPLEFDFSDPYVHGTPLMTTGHGNYSNADSDMTLKEDRDCMIYSKSGQFARVKKQVIDKNDNDDQDKGISDQITAFATGCDISPGDSGSPLVNRDSQRVIGMIWSTSTPKPIKVTTDEYLDSLILGLENQNDIWLNLSYAVSTRTMRERLIRWTNEIDRGGFGLQRRRETILRLLGL